MIQQKAGSKRWPGCPLNASVETPGNRWSRLIIRDLILQGARTYETFLECYEEIAADILAGRLKKLAAHGIIAMNQTSAQFLLLVDGVLVVKAGVQRAFGDARCGQNDVQVSAPKGRAAPLFEGNPATGAACAL
jgi:hypothetical protein